MSTAQDAILQYIAANPGIRLADVESKLEISSGHHKIHSLMKKRLVRREVMRDGGNPWFAYFAVGP